MITRRHPPFNASFFAENRRRLKAMLPPDSLFVIRTNDQFLRNGDVHYEFRPDSSFFYLTGIEEPGSALIMSHENPIADEMLFVPPADKSAETWDGKRLTADEATQLSGVENVEPIGGFEARLARLAGMYRQVIAVYPYLSVTPQGHSLIRYLNDLRDVHPGLTILSGHDLVARLRSIKQPVEIESLRKASEITKDALYTAWEEMKPGMKEYEVESRIQFEMKRRGSQRYGYNPIVASGKNAAILHYITCNDALEAGDTVLFDVGAEYGNYSADVSRCAPTDGHFSSKHRRLYQALLDVQKECINRLQVGKTWKAYNAECRDLVREMAEREGLLKPENDKSRSEADWKIGDLYPHRIGHHLGLDVHDVGRHPYALQAGQVWTVEPGIYNYEEGWGFRIEDDVLLREDGVDVLTASITKEADEIEAVCQGQGG